MQRRRFTGWPRQTVPGNGRIQDSSTASLISCCRCFSPNLVSRRLWCSCMSHHSERRAKVTKSHYGLGHWKGYRGPYHSPKQISGPSSSHSRWTSNHLNNIALQEGTSGDRWRNHLYSLLLAKTEVFFLSQCMMETSGSLMWQRSIILLVQGHWRTSFSILEDVVMLYFLFAVCGFVYVATFEPRSSKTQRMETCHSQTYWALGSSLAALAN